MRCLAVDATAGKVHDSQCLETILTKVKVHQRQGRPKSRPKRLAGQAYSGNGIREFLEKQGIEAIILYKDNKKARYDPAVRSTSRRTGGEASSSSASGG